MTGGQELWTLFLAFFSKCQMIMAMALNTLLLKSTDSVQIDIVLCKGCPSYAPLKYTDIDL